MVLLSCPCIWYYYPDASNFNLQHSSRFDELPDEFDLSGRLPGSFDDGDPQTTNLYVGNLSPKVDLTCCSCSV
jgi:hypothetical protein